MKPKRNDWEMELLTPPWKPDVDSPWDTKYIPDEFAQEPLQMTPNRGAFHMADHLNPIQEDSKLPYFEKFSYHRSSRSYGGEGYLSASAHTTSELF
ncbi:hypothetical protein ACOMHN_056185 [Nucella lapillus]